MKKQLLTLLTILTTAVLSFGQSQSISIPLSKPGESFTLKAGLVYGSINLTEYSGKTILIEADRKQTEFYKDSKEKGGLTRISGNGGLELEAEEKDNVVEVSVPGWTKAVTLNIKVPTGASRIEVSTINNGNIVIENVSGEVEVKNVNGDVFFKNVSGSVIASTINGNLRGTFKTLDSKAPLAFSTLNGDVDITFPASFKANMKMKSDRGDIYTDFELMKDGSTDEVIKTQKNGMNKIRIENWVRGKINGGGPEVLMKNMNGNIYVRKSPSSN